MKNIFTYYFILCLLASLFSCSDEQIRTLTDFVPEGYLALEIIVPGHAEAPTRGMIAKDECKVKDIDVLGFNETDKKFFFHVHVQESDVKPTGDNGNKKTFYIKLPEEALPSKAYFMLIANAHQKVLNAVSDENVAKSKTKEQFMCELMFECAGKWATNDSVPFPMWGLSKEVDLAGTIDSLKIPLIRSVAKIDVVNTSGDFTLEKVYVHNTLDKLLIAPDPKNYNDVDYKVTDPSVPESGVNAQVLECAAKQDSCANRIYVAEHAAGSNADRANNFCLIISGKYKADTNPTYYRVDLMNTTRDVNSVVTAQKYLPVLRNHHYKINIKEVAGRGYKEKDDAFDALGVNTNLDVVVTYTDESQTYYVSDQQYVLSAEKKEFIYDNRQHTGNAISIYNNYEKGWKATVTSPNTDWITLTTSSGGKGTSPLRFNLSANASGAPDRTGIITIQAGRLTMEIIVKQQLKTETINTIEASDVLHYYTMNSEYVHQFNIKSDYDWKMKVKSDPKGILNTYPVTSGSGSPTKTPIPFKLINDVYDLQIIDAEAVLTFYSETNEFQELDVTIRGVSAFELGGLYVYPIDQPRGPWKDDRYLPNWPNGRMSDWAVFSSRDISRWDYLQSDNPPIIEPPCEGSCAALPAPVGNRWRLPKGHPIWDPSTLKAPELIQIFIDAASPRGFKYSPNSLLNPKPNDIGLENLLRHGFAVNEGAYYDEDYYWTSTTATEWGSGSRNRRTLYDVNSWTWNDVSQEHPNYFSVGQAKPHPTYIHGRCVRDKQ